MSKIDEVIEKYELENEKILKQRPELQMITDFTYEGTKLFQNTLFINDLKKLRPFCELGEIAVQLLDDNLTIPKAEALENKFTEIAVTIKEQSIVRQKIKEQGDENNT